MSRDRATLEPEAQQRPSASVVDDPTGPIVARLADGRMATGLLDMQRTLGNGAVQRLIQRLQNSAQAAAAHGPVVQRTTVVAKNGVEHSEDPSTITTDEQGVTRDAAGNVVTFRAPDGAWVEDPGTSTPADASQSSSAAAPSGTSDQTPQPGGGDAARSVADMTAIEKLVEAYTRAPIDAAVRQKILSLLTPEALAAALIGFAAVFVAAQFTPVGWAADLGIALTAVFIGTALFAAIEHLIRFADARNATTPEQLDQAGWEFAQAVAEIEIDAIILLITHGATGGARGGVPYEGPPPRGFVLATSNGMVVPVAAETISAEVAAQLGIRGAVATGPMMSRGSGPRQFEPPARDNTGKVHSPPGEDIPLSPEDRQAAIDTWTPDELESAADELEQSIAARQAEQQRLGEDSVGANGQPTGAQHRVRIQKEEALLRAIRKKQSGS